MAVRIVSDGSDVVSFDERTWSWDEDHRPFSPHSHTGSLRCDPLEIYRTQPAVRTVVGFLATNLAQISIHAFHRAANGDRERMRSDTVLGALMKAPNPVTTSFEFIHSLVVDVCLFDRYAARLLLQNDGSYQLVRLPPEKWRFEREPDGRPKAVRMRKSNGDFVELALDRMFWIDGYPTDKDMSPMVTLMGLLEEEALSGQFRRELWRNGGRFGGYWVYTPPSTKPLDEKRHRVFRKQLERWSQGGDRAGKIPLFEQGKELRPIDPSITPESAQQLQSRKFAIATVAAAYYVPSVFAGLLENANYQGVVGYREMLYMDVLGPWFTNVQQALNARVVPHVADPDDYVEFNVKEKLRLSPAEEAKVLQTAVGGPFMTRAEARERENLQRIEGTDELITPMNVTVGGQASPTDSAAALLRAALQALESPEREQQ